MAVAVKNPLSANQYSFLTNTAAGKTSTGGVATAGNQNWAKEQLANSSYTPALNAVKQSVGAVQQQPTVQSAPTAQAAPAAITQPTSRTNQTLDRIGQLANAQPFQYQGPAAFAYDQNTDPAYQAALASARSNITQGQADTNARLRAGGQGKSSYSESVANQISAGELGRVSTEVLPQLINQAYQRYADQSNRDMQLQQANYGAQQDQVSNLAGLYGMQDQQDFRNPMAEAQLTGQYLPGEARQYIDAINALKAQAETPGIARDEMLGYRNQADAYRAALQGLGVDASLFGADVNRETAMGNRDRAGILTMDKQQQNYTQSADQRNYERGVVESDRGFDFQKTQTEWQNNFQQAQTDWENNFKTGQFDWQKGQQTWENAFQEKNFQQSMKDAAASRGLQWASLSQRDKEFVADQAFRDKQFNYGKEQDKIANDLAANKASSTAKTATPTKNEIEADYYTNLDRMNDSQLENFFKNEKSNIIADLGKSGYDSLKSAYGLSEY